MAAQRHRHQSTQTRVQLLTRQEWADTPLRPLVLTGMHPAMKQMGLVALAVLVVAVP